MEMNADSRAAHDAWHDTAVETNAHAIMTCSTHVLPHTVAIDGPAASGKSTLSERLAELLGYFTFDTGVMYRAATFAALERGVPVHDETAVTRLAQSLEINVMPPADGGAGQCVVTLDGRDVSSEIHFPAVDRNVSVVSTYPGVRQAMTAQQRKIAARGRTIMAGRDIGTVVVPDAECKIFLTASVDARAQRRMLDRQQMGQSVSLDQMRQEIAQRDELDSTRTLAPLRRAPDAILLDNTCLTFDETVQRALEIIQHRARELATQP